MYACACLHMQFTEEIGTLKQFCTAYGNQSDYSEIRCTTQIPRENCPKYNIRSRIFIHSTSAEELDPNLSIWPIVTLLKHEGLFFLWWIYWKQICQSKPSVTEPRKDLLFLLQSYLQQSKSKSLKMGSQFIMCFLDSFIFYCWPYYRYVPLTAPSYPCCSQKGFTSFLQNGMEDSQIRILILCDAILNQEEYNNYFSACCTEA